MPASRLRYLDRESAAALLRAGGARLVLAHGGEAPAWVPPERTFEVWREVRGRVLAPDARPDNDGELRYWASEWTGGGHGALILLEAVH